MAGLIDSLFSLLEAIIVNHGFLGVFFVFFIAQVIAPIPTPLLMVASGAFFLKDGFSLEFLNTLIFSIAIPASLGVTIGSIFVYYIGFLVGKPFLEKWGKILSLSWKGVEKIQAKFEKSHVDEIALFSLRAIPIFPTVSISFVSGLIRLKMSSYLIFTFLGTFARVLILAILGWQTGVLYRHYAYFVESLEKFGLILIILSALFYFIYKFKKKKQKYEK